MMFDRWRWSPRNYTFYLLALIAGFNSWNSVAEATDAQSQKLFQQLLKEAGATYKQPDGFRDADAKLDAVFPYEKAIRHKTQQLEIRYTVRPLGRLKIDYDDPHNSAPEPNHLFPLMFDSITAKISAGGHTPSREYSRKQAKALFNADWAAAAAFDVDPQYSRGFSQGLLVAMHKNAMADTYVVFLYNNYATVKPIIDHNISALRFGK